MLLPFASQASFVIMGGSQANLATLAPYTLEETRLAQITWGGFV